MPDLKKLDISPSVAILVAGFVIAAAIVYTNLHPAQPIAQAEQPAAAAVRAVQPSDYYFGSKNASVVLIEYSDFQCPFCSLIYPNLKKIVADSNGGVAWVMREFPLSSIHQNALPAAEAAQCIGAQLGSEGYGAFADAIFADQKNMSAARYAQLARQLGADMARYNSCLSAHTYAARIDADTAEVQANGGQGTPFTVVLNTKTGAQRSFSGALPLEQILAIIKAAQ